MMNLRLKRLIEDCSKTPIKKYTRIYHGKYEANRDEDVYNSEYLPTFTNYGILSSYCQVHNYIKTKNHNICCVRCDKIKVRVLRNEMKIIKDNHMHIPQNLIDKIMSREV